MHLKIMMIFLNIGIRSSLRFFSSSFGDDSAEKYIGISDQVYATELDAKADSLLGYPKPIADAYPVLLIEKDIYVNRVC